MNPDNVIRTLKNCVFKVQSFLGEDCLKVWKGTLYKIEYSDTYEKAYYCNGEGKAFTIPEELIQSLLDKQEIKVRYYNGTDKIQIL